MEFLADMTPRYEKEPFWSFERGEDTGERNLLGFFDDNI